MKKNLEMDNEQTTSGNLLDRANAEHRRHANLVKQMEVIAQLGPLLNSVTTLLDRLDTLVENGDQRPVGWMAADKPIKALRDYVRDLFARADAANKGPERFVAAARAKLVEEPAPGHELISAARLMAEVIKVYLYWETIGAAAMTTSLSNESRDAILEEMAREELPDARTDTFLAYMKICGLEMCEEDRWVDTERRGISRRRHNIDEIVARFMGPCKAEIKVQVETELAQCSPNSPAAPWLRSLKAMIENEDDSELRKFVKRWVNFCLVSHWMAWRQSGDEMPVAAPQ